MALRRPCRLLIPLATRTEAASCTPFPSEPSSAALNNVADRMQVMTSALPKTPVRRSPAVPSSDFVGSVFWPVNWLYRSARSGASFSPSATYAFTQSALRPSSPPESSAPWVEAPLTWRGARPALGRPPDRATGACRRSWGSRRAGFLLRVQPPLPDRTGKEGASHRPTSTGGVGLVSVAFLALAAASLASLMSRTTSKIGFTIPFDEGEDGRARAAEVGRRYARVVGAGEAHGQRFDLSHRVGREGEGGHRVVGEAADLDHQLGRERIATEIGVIRHPHHTVEPGERLLGPVHVRAVGDGVRHGAEEIAQPGNRPRLRLDDPDRQRTATRAGVQERPTWTTVDGPGGQLLLAAYLLVLDRRQADVVSLQPAYGVEAGAVA